jgi:hypothetical protein
VQQAPCYRQRARSPAARRRNFPPRRCSRIEEPRCPLKQATMRDARRSPAYRDIHVAHRRAPPRDGLTDNRNRAQIARLDVGGGSSVRVFVRASVRSTISVRHRSRRCAVVWRASSSPEFARIARAWTCRESPPPGAARGRQGDRFGISCRAACSVCSLPLKGGGLGRGSTRRVQCWSRATPTPTLPLSGGGSERAVRPLPYHVR